MEKIKNISSLRLGSLFNNDNSTSAGNVKIDPVSSEILLRFQIGMAGIWYTIGIAGICSNVLSLRTFAIMGLKDSVTVAFFCLAISDLNFCAFAFLSNNAFLFDIYKRAVGHHFYLPPMTVSYFFLCVRKIFNTTTIMITTFLAAQRCLCVVMPFQVKGMFTRSRTVAFVVVVLSCSATISTLYMWRHRVVLGMNEALNASELQLYVPPGSEPYLFLMEVFVGMALTFTCQAVVMACLVVVAITLRRSSQFRKSATVQVTTATTTTASSVTNAKTTNTITDEKIGPPSKQGKERTKEKQALIQVSLVSVLFVIAYLPYLASGLAYALVPGYGIYLPFHNIFVLAHNIMFTMELLNSSVNVIIYYTCNTKFRKRFPYCKSKRQS